MTTLPERLRAETRGQHEQMEAIFRMPSSCEEHRQWTAAFLGFVEPLERALTATLGAEHPALVGRAKTGWLRDDLRALGCDDRQIAALPRCADLPALDTAPRALGALYVFEGSTLGGQMISRHLETALGLSGGEGYRYFRSYGPEVGRRWQEFRALLERQGEAGGADEIVQSANDTFSKLRRWCESQRPSTRASLPPTPAPHA